MLCYNAIKGGKWMNIEFSMSLFWIVLTVILVVAVIGATPLPKKIISKIENKNVGNLIISIAEPIFLVVVTVLSTAYLVDGSFNPFLYFRF